MAKGFAGNSSYGELYKLYMAATKFDAVLLNLLESKGYLHDIRRLLREHDERQKARRVASFTFDARVQCPTCPHSGRARVKAVGASTGAFCLGHHIIRAH